MQNNYNNWFHLPPHFRYIQPASASPQPLLNLPDKTRFGQEFLTKYPLKAHQKQ